MHISFPYLERYHADGESRVRLYTVQAAHSSQGVYLLLIAPGVLTWNRCRSKPDDSRDLAALSDDLKNSPTAAGRWAKRSLASLPTEETVPFSVTFRLYSETDSPRLIHLKPPIRPRNRLPSTFPPLPTPRPALKQPINKRRIDPTHDQPPQLRLPPPELPSSPSPT